MPSLALTSISKGFGRVLALDRVDFSVEPGTVHALLGENGAGKSTLMHIAYGMLSPDTGQVQVNGRPVSISSPRAARQLGIGMVHQHFTSVPALTVGENIRLAGGRIRHSDTQPVLNRFLADLPLDAPVETLSVGLKQRLEIVKALATDARILLLDEPTAVLAPIEIEELIGAIRAFAAQGGSVVLITHKLDEALKAADAVTVLRRGRVTLAAPVAGLTSGALAEAMIGAMGEEPATPVSEGSRNTPGSPALVLEGLSVPPMEGRGPGLQGATLSIMAGELVGIAAVEGNGQRELLLAIAGVLRPGAGRMELAGPVSLVPEDRTTEGLIPELSLTENVVLGRSSAAPWIRGGWIDWPAARFHTGELMAAFDVRAPDPGTTAALLSGGNQQKLILARALEQRPRVLVVENPTRGLDIRATAAVHTRLRQAAAAGIAVLVHSSDLDEVMQLAHRVFVVARGRVVEAPRDRGVIGRLILGLDR